MSPSHFLCWYLYGPFCTKPYFSRSFAEVTSNKHLHAGAWDGSWTWQRQLLYLASIHFLKASYWFFTFKRDLQQLWLSFIFISFFFSPPKFVIERDRSPSGTLDRGCTGVLLLLAAAPHQDKAVWRLHLLRAEGNTMPNSFHSLHNAGHKALLGDSCTVK